MVKHLTKTGNSLALVLDKQILERTHIDADTKLEVSTDGDTSDEIEVADVPRAAAQRRARRSATVP